MKRINIFQIISLLAFLCSAVICKAHTIEYPLVWNAGICNVEIPAAEGESASAVESAVSSYISSSSITWISLDSVEPGSTSELWMLCFTVSDNTGGGSRSADFMPWNFRIIQAAQGVTGPSVTSPSGGIITVYPGAAVTVTVDNLTSSLRTDLKRRPLSGGAWEHVDSLAMAAPSCSFTKVLEDGEYMFSTLGIGFTVLYHDILYYSYSVSGLYSNNSFNCNGGVLTGYITAYTDKGGIQHPVDSSLLAQLQQLFAWYGSGSATGWNPGIQLQASITDSRIAVSASTPPNFGATRTWDTGLRLSPSSSITYSQPAGGDILQKICSTNAIRAQISSSQYGVTYIVSDGEHNLNAVGTNSTINIYLAGSGISGAYSVHASYGGRIRLIGKYVPENDIPQAEGQVEASGPNSIVTSTMNGISGNAVDVVYYNGLGLEKQEVKVRASGDGLNDVVRLVRLDHLGRKWRSYLPYADSGVAGAYRCNAFGNQAQWWYTQGINDEGSEYAYATTIMEASTDGRKLSDKLPGEDYHDASHDTDYSYTGETIPILSVNSSGMLSLSGYYALGTVSCESVTDGDGHVTLSYSDREGRRIADGPSGALVYYAYDPCGRLAWVVSPEGFSRLSNGISYASDSDFAARYCYVNTFDSRGRQVEKRIPGAAPQYFVYDAGDRLAFFQDGNMRDGGKWKAFFYDTCGRLVREDLRTAGNGDSRVSLQDGFDSSSAPALYSTTSGVTLLHTYVFDAYPLGLESRLAFQPDTVATQGILRSSPKGLQVYEDLAVLGTTQTASRARYYDGEDRVIQEVTLYPDGTVLRTSTAYDLQGRVVKSINRYQDINAVIGNVTQLVDSWQYDARGRVSSQQSHLIVDNHTTESSVSYIYDELGRLWKTFYGPELSRVAVQQLSYAPQGWEVGRTVAGNSNNTIFSSILHYESPLSNYDYISVNNPVSWTGRISSWEWQHQGEPLNAKTFTYDSKGHLTSAYHYSAKILDNQYSETFLYDLNSNIISHTQYDYDCMPSTMNSTFLGNHNQDYDYDANGNITCLHDIFEEGNEYDFSSVVLYNILNLPHHISTVWNEDCDYRFLADGTKISAIGYEDMGYKYAGPFRYQLVLGDAFLESCPAAGGRFWCLDGETDPDAYLLDPSPRYFLSDYLGNTRAIVNDDGALSMQADYQPYGRIIYRLSPYEENNSYLWTGKEQQTSFFETSWYDSGARFLTTNGFFFSPDPLAEKYPGVSPYAYCAGDPVNLVDPDGTSTSTHIDNNGRVIAVYNDGDLGVYMHKGDKKEIEEQLKSAHSSSNTSAGGEKVGESLQIFSFAINTKQDEIRSVKPDNITILLGSDELTEAVQDIIDAKPSVIEYMKTAQGGADWDLKEQPRYKGKGSLLFGKYASPRDAGNFAAGYFSASQGVFSPVIDFGYGFYNLSSNNEYLTAINAALFVFSPLPLSVKGLSFVLISKFGEARISRISQKAGKQYYYDNH